jgi:recombination protein RecT
MAETQPKQQSLEARTAPAAAVPPAAVPTPAEIMKAEEQVVSDRRIFQVRNTLEKLRGHITSALPKHISAERFIRITLTAVQRTPKLLDCDPTSFFAAIMQCAALGLEPDGLLGHAYLIPFKTQVQFIPGYRGLCKLVRQSGEIAGIYARVVRARDRFDYAYGLDQRLEHAPFRGPEHGELTATYAVARFRGEGDLPQFDVMERWEVDRIREMSQGWQRAEKGQKDSPWHLHYEAMAMKTVLRRLCKLLPQSVDKDHLARAIALDEQAEANLPQSFDTSLLPPIEPERQELPASEQGRRMPLGKRETPAAPAAEPAREPGEEG